MSPSRRTAADRVALSLLTLALLVAVGVTAVAGVPDAGGAGGSADTGCVGIEAAQVYPFEKPAVASGAGLVVFATGAALVPEDTNGDLDIYAWDPATEAYERLSVAQDGSQADGSSRAPATTPDGRFVVFQSGAQLVPGDDDGITPDVYRLDRDTGTLVQVSVGHDGQPTLRTSTNPVVSDDGTVVAFASAATNIVPGDTNDVIDVFVRDMVAGETIRASVASDGTEGTSRSGAAYMGIDISADGRFVAFGSGANNLAPGASGNWDVFVHDTVTRETEQVSIATDGSQGAGNIGAVSIYPSMSADGRYVAFASSATNFGPDDGPSTKLDWTTPQVFVRDRQAGTTTQVSVASDGTPANDASYGPSISADGRFVAFASLASNLAPGDANGERDVYVHDRASGTTERLSVGPNGGDSTPGGALQWGSFSAAIAPDGTGGAFVSGATNLVEGDANGAFDVFVWTAEDDGLTRLATPCVTGASAPATGTVVDGGSSWAPGLIGLPLLGMLWAGPRRAGAVVAVLAMVFGMSLAPATAHHYAPVQPGAPGPATLNFIFEDEAGDLYIGSCGHCTRSPWGVDGPVGLDIEVPGAGKIGTTVYGRYDLFGAHKQDFVLVKVDEDKHHLIDPSVRYWGGPTGVATDTLPGTPTLSYGFGVGLRASEQTRAQEGVLTHVEPSGPWKGWYFNAHPVSGGNSGGPMMTGDGKALGTVIILAAAVAQPGDNGGPTIEYILAELGTAGFDLNLVTAPFPGNPVETAEHCANEPVEEDVPGSGCVRPSV